MARNVYFAFLLYIVFEGALRKWVFPGASNALFLLKDVILFAALVTLIVSDQRRAAAAWRNYASTETIGWLLLIGIVCVALVFSGISATSLAGMRYYLAVLPILLLQPAVFRTLEEMQTALSWYVYIAIFVCGIGFLQFMSPPSSWINNYAWTTAGHIATFGDVGEADIGNAFSFVRITGTFSYITPFVSYLQFLFFATLGLFVLAKTDRQRLVFGGTVGMLFATILMSGSRSPVVVCALLALPFVALAKEAVFKDRGAILGVAGGILIIVALLALFSDVMLALQTRNTQAGDAPARIWGALLTPISTIAGASFFGEGLGTTFLGVAEATAGATYTGAIFDEVSQDRIGIELGVPVYLFFLAIKLYFLFATFGLYRRARSFDIRVWSLVSFAYQASLLWQIPIYNSVGSTFYFVSVAAYVWLRRLNDAALVVPRRRVQPGAAAWRA